MFFFSSCCDKSTSCTFTQVNGYLQGVNGWLIFGTYQKTCCIHDIEFLISNNAAKTRLQLHQFTLFLQGLLGWHLCLYLVFCHNQRWCSRSPCITLTRISDVVTITLIWCRKELKACLLSELSALLMVTKNWGGYWCYCTYRTLQKRNKYGKNTFKASKKLKVQGKRNKVKLNRNDLYKAIYGKPNK